MEFFYCVQPFSFQVHSLDLVLLVALMLRETAHCHPELAREEKKQRDFFDGIGI
jgi:hypothetical protein